MNSYISILFIPYARTNFIIMIPYSNTLSIITNIKGKLNYNDTKK